MACSGLPVHYLLRLTNKFDIFPELKGKSINVHGSKLKGEEPSCFYHPNHPTLFWCRTNWSNSRFDDQWGVGSVVSIKCFFSPPARWGSLDFNKGVPASLTPTHSYSLLPSFSSPRLLLCHLVAEPYHQLRMQLGTPEPELYSASSGGSWARLGPNCISRALEAFEHAWAGTHARENARKSAKQCQACQIECQTEY